MNDLQIFKNQEFGEIQIIEVNNKFEFGATEVAKMLGYINPHKAIIDHCKKDGLTKREVIDNLRRKQEKNFISEGNLYRLITHSKLPSAERFERWVFDEVLPSIRKAGGYIVGQNQLSDSELMAKAVLVAQNTIAEKEKLLAVAYKQIEADSQKVYFANAVSTSKSSILVGELAKILKQTGYDIGQNRLFEWLREKGYLISRKGTDYNMPTQKSMDLGLFEIKETIITSSNGSTNVRKTAKVTGKGQVYLVNKYTEYQNKST